MQGFLERKMENIKQSKKYALLNSL